MNNRQALVFAGEIGNNGDLAILMSMRRLLEAAGIAKIGVSQWTTPTAIAREAIAAEGVKLVPSKSFASLVTAVGALHVIGGGQLVRTNQSTKAVALLLIRIWIGKLTGGRAIALGLGVDNLDNSRLRWLWRAVLTSCDAVYVRDELSSVNALALGARPVRAADLVFLLNDLFPSGGEQRNTIVIAPCIDAGERRDVNAAHVAALVAEAKRRWPAVRLTFALHDEGLDRLAMETIVGASGLVVDEVVASGRPIDFAMLYARSILTITNRLHSIIFSLQAEAPVVCLNDGRKVDAAAKEMELISLGIDDEVTNSAVTEFVDRAVATAGASLARARERAELNRVGLASVLCAGVAVG